MKQKDNVSRKLVSEGGKCCIRCDQSIICWAESDALCYQCSYYHGLNSCVTNSICSLYCVM